LRGSHPPVSWLIRMQATFGFRAKTHYRAKQPAPRFRQRRASSSGYTPACTVSATAALLFCRLRRSPSLIVSFGNAWQLLQERDDGPQFVVFRSSSGKTWHAGHVDAVLHHPKQLRRRHLLHDVLEVGRVWTKSFRELGPFHAGRAMAVGTTELVESTCAILHLGRIVKARGWLILRMADDRIDANFHQRPVDNSGILLVGSNTVKAAKEIDRTDYGKSDCK